MVKEDITLVYMGGDGYTESTAQPFLNYLNQHGIKTIYIPLREEDENCSYDDLETENYCQYIDGFIPKATPNLYGYGISKGSHWIRVYASKRPRTFKKLILVEETTMTPELMVEYEHSRGNDYVEEFYHNPNDIPGLNSTDKALDVIVSDHAKYCPKGMPIHVVFTSRNNMNEPYSEDVVQLKNRYVQYLKRNGCQVRVHKFNSDHCIDTHPQYFPQLLSIIAD